MCELLKNIGSERFGKLTEMMGSGSKRFVLAPSIESVKEYVDVSSEYKEVVNEFGYSIFRPVGYYSIFYFVKN